MKKILEILQYGETELRFKTDLKPAAHPDSIMDLISRAAFSMMTSLWGGNEQDVLAVIRALSIADLAVSTNRKEMIRMMDEESKAVAQMIREAMQQMEKGGARIMTFPPGIGPAKTKS